MARLNVKKEVKAFTHEGAPAFAHLNAEKQLRRSILSCLLWEDEFYEDGKSIADRISEYAAQVKPEVLAALAAEARTVHNLRHAPLLLLEVLSRTGHGAMVAEAVARVIQRPDELGEFMAIYTGGGDRRKAKAGKGHTLTAPVRKGLAKAFGKFDEYQLAKYNRDGAVKLRDMLRLVRPKPVSDDQSALFKRVKDGTLATPDTWEVGLSAGGDKKETFERLLREGKLGYLALLRNLRNMAQAGVDASLVKDAILARKGAARVLPFRYVAAARAAPQFERELDLALCAVVAEMPRFSGSTLVLVDVSGSMDWALSGKSDMKRIDAAAALAAMVPGDVRMFSFSNNVIEVPPRHGMAGVDAITNSQGHGGTYLGKAVERMNTIKADRLIVITDEQSHDRVPDPAHKHAYMINVASFKNGVGYGKWVHVDGFSESILKFIRELEAA